MESGRALVRQWIARCRSVARTYTAAAGTKRATQHGAAVMTTSSAEQRNNDDDNEETAAPADEQATHGAVRPATADTS